MRHKSGRRDRGHTKNRILNALKMVKEKTRGRGFPIGRQKGRGRDFIPVPAKSVEPAE